MKSIFLSLLFILASFQLYASSRGITSYYSYINKAESSLCGDDIEDARRQYDTAYAIMKNRMGSRSLYNYFLVCFDLKRYNRCGLILKELKRRGWALPAFTTQLEKFYSDEAMEHLTRIYQSTGKDPNPMDVAYTARIDSLVNVDQVTNRILREKNAGILDPSAQDSFFRLARQSMAVLNEWFKVKFPADYVVSRGEQPFNTLRYGVILIHNAQPASNESHVLDEVLFKAVQNGEMDPVDFDYYMSYHNGASGRDTTLHIDGIKLSVPMSPYSFALIQRSLYQWPEDTARIRICNVERKKIPGLYRSEDLRMRLIFQYQNPKYRMFSDSYIIPIDFELSERIMKQLILIPKM